MDTNLNLHITHQHPDNEWGRVSSPFVRVQYCYDFSFVSLTHVFLTSDSRFTSSSFHRFNRFRSMFHIHAFYFYMPITCISTHVFHTCYLHVFFYLLITCHASMAYLYINLSVDLVVSLASL